MSSSPPPLTRVCGHVLSHRPPTPESGLACEMISRPDRASSNIVIPSSDPSKLNITGPDVSTTQAAGSPCHTPCAVLGHTFAAKLVEFAEMPCGEVVEPSLLLPLEANRFLLDAPTYGHRYPRLAVLIVKLRKTTAHDKPCCGVDL